MIYLLWAFLNFGLIIFFIFICINATKLIKEKFGIFTSIIFVFGIVSFIGRSNFDQDNIDQNTQQYKTWKFNSSDSLVKDSNRSIDIELEKTLISKYSLGISYFKDLYLQNNIPVSAKTWTTGLHGGTSWKPIFINIKRTEDYQIFKYEVVGIIKWSLLGMTLYSQPKRWKGVAVLK